MKFVIIIIIIIIIVIFKHTQHRTSSSSFCHQYQSYLPFAIQLENKLISFSIFYTFNSFHQVGKSGESLVLS